MTKDLEEFGLARVYGITFDSDSAHVKDESKPALDKFVTPNKSHHLRAIVRLTT